METSPQEFVVVGWYDGITEAFVQEFGGRWIYASIIAYDPKKKLKIFGAVEADAQTVSEVRALCAASEVGEGTVENWRRIRTRISKFLGTVEGEAELKLCEELDGETKASRRIDAGAILEELGREIEDAVGSTRFALWMSKFSV